MSSDDVDGWIYCLINESIPNQVKVGQTANNPNHRAKQISGTGVPTPHKVAFAKKVKDYKRKEKLLHQILSKDGGRTNPKREFFKCEPDHVKLLFDLIDGEWLKIDEVGLETNFDIKNNTKSSMKNKVNNTINNDINIEVHRKERDYLISNSILLDGVDIKHVIKEKGIFAMKHSRYGKYNKVNNIIICNNGKVYKNLEEFVNSHYIDEKLAIKNENQLNNLFYEYRGKWWPISNLLN